MSNHLSVSRAESRARAIRAVVAAQWAVAQACGAQWFEDMDAGNQFDAIAIVMIRRLAALPTPEQIVDGDDSTENHR